MTSLNDTTQTALDAFITTVGEKDAFGTFLTQLKDAIKKERDTEATAPAVTADADATPTPADAPAAPADADAAPVANADAAPVANADAAPADADAVPVANADAAPADADAAPVANADAAPTPAATTPVADADAAPGDTDNFTSLLKVEDIEALNAAINQITSLPEGTNDFDTYTENVLANELDAYYALIKPELQKWFVDCYNKDTNDTATKRVIFDILSSSNVNPVTTIDEYKEVFKNFQAEVRVDGGPCPEKIDISGRKTPAGTPFTTEIILDSKKIKKKFSKQDNPGGGDCLFYTLLDILERADPARYNSMKGNDKKDKIMAIRDEIVNYVTNPGNANTVYDGRTTTFDHMLKNGIQSQGGLILFENSDTSEDNKYSIQMKKNGTWGTDVEISAAAKLYGINIYVLLSTGQDQVYYSGNSPDYDLTKLWYIYNYDRTHYVVAWCLDGSGNCPPNSGARPDET